MTQTITWNSESLRNLEQELLPKLEYLFHILNIDVDLDYECYKGICPIHEYADNPTAFNFNLETGRWACYTKKCHDVFKGTLIGFVRGILSRNQGWKCQGNLRVSFEDTLKFLYDFLKTDLSKLPQRINFKKHIQSVSFSKGTLTRSQIRKKLEIPSPYFVARGFSKDILDKFDVGECQVYGKRMGGRAVVPVYNFDWRLIGCTGRSIYEKCDDCGYYHISQCPEKYFSYYSKWLHSKGFPRKDWLFNLQRAAKKIRETQTIIIVESPMNVIRLAEAGINNAVCLFGSSLTYGQKRLIDCSGAFNIVLILDNDEAGRIGVKKIVKRLHKTYKIKNIRPPVNDIGEMSVDSVKRLVYPVLENLK
jgi:5S rRNA maturation endonuclease (ribonuclease M5)